MRKPVSTTGSFSFSVFLSVALSLSYIYICISVTLKLIKRVSPGFGPTGSIQILVFLLRNCVNVGTPPLNSLGSVYFSVREGNQYVDAGYVLSQCYSDSLKTKSQENLPERGCVGRVEYVE